MEGSEQQPRSIPAGWYPDPTGAGLRWWDGSGWTEHTASERAATGQAAAGQAASGTGAEQHPAAAAPASAAEPTTAGEPTTGGAAAASGTGAEQHPAAAAPASAAEPTAAATPAATAGTDPVAVSGTAVAGQGGPSRGEWALSVILPILPLAGLIWGVYLNRRGDGSESAGNVAVVLSLAVILVAVLFLL